MICDRHNRNTNLHSLNFGDLREAPHFIQTQLHEDSMAVSLANAEQEQRLANSWTTDMNVRPDGDEN